MHLRSRTTSSSLPPWTGGCVEIFLDTRPPEKVGSPILEEGVYQVFIMPPDENDKVLPERRMPKGLLCAGKRTPHAYAVEMSTPLELSKGRILGFDIAVNDANNKADQRVKRKAQMVWHGTANTWEDPSAYARLKISRRLDNH